MLYYFDSSCQLDGYLTWCFPVDGKVFWWTFIEQLSLSLPGNETQQLLLPWMLSLALDSERLMLNLAEPSQAVHQGCFTQRVASSLGMAEPATHWLCLYSLPLQPVAAPTSSTHLAGGGGKAFVVLVGSWCSGIWLVPTCPATQCYWLLSLDVASQFCLHPWAALSELKAWHFFVESLWHSRLHKQIQTLLKWNLFMRKHSTILIWILKEDRQ